MAHPRGSLSQGQPWKGKPPQGRPLARESHTLPQEAAQKIFVQTLDNWIYFLYSKPMSRYVHERTCIRNINYHIIWCVKYRCKVLTPHIASRLCCILQETAETRGFQVVDAQVGHCDHVHCFVSAPPRLSVSEIVRVLKGRSGLLLFREFPELRKSLWHGRLWSPSYFVETVGSTSQENIMRYIQNQ